MPLYNIVQHNTDTGRTTSRACVAYESLAHAFQSLTRAAACDWSTLTESLGVCSVLSACHTTTYSAMIA